MKTNKIILSLTFILALFTATAQKAPFELPKLPYAFDALEPAIDARTMEIHYSKHHAAYVKNLNTALQGTEDAEYPLDELLLYAGEFSPAIRNNAGGHYNHSLFWSTLSKNHPFNPSSEVGKAVTGTFGSIDSLYRALAKAGAAQFGSGWAWLYVTNERKLAVCATPNQDNPIMDVAKHRGVPIFGIDVWEHAYYLKYQNLRADYLQAVLSLVNWEAVNNNYTAAMNGELLRTIERETWQALHDFHVVMAETFHPSEEGNLEPIKRRSEEMVEMAVNLQTRPIPVSFNNPEIHQSIADLIAGSKELNELIAGGADDKTITERLNKLHDVFHTIQGQCRH